MRIVNDTVERLFLIIGSAMFALFIVVIFLQVVARSYLRLSILWTDEVALICFIWSVFLGAAVAFRRRAHYTVEILPGSMVRTNQALTLFAHVATLAVIYVMIVGGWTYAGMGMRRMTVALEIPQATMFAAIPVSGVAMALFAVELIREDLRRLVAGGAPKTVGPIQE